jgi:hypothetical protein
MHIFSKERRLAGEDLVQRDAERPDVSARINVLGGPQLLG